MYHLPCTVGIGTYRAGCGYMRSDEVWHEKAQAGVKRSGGGMGTPTCSGGGNGVAESGMTRNRRVYPCRYEPTDTLTVQPDEDGTIGFQTKTEAGRDSVWLNKEQARNLRDKLTEFIGEEPAETELWRDE